MSDDILVTLDRAWDEDFKANLMHYCDLAGQEIRKLRKERDETKGEVIQTQDELGALLHAAEAERDAALKQLEKANAEVVHTQDELGALLHAAEAEIDTLKTAMTAPTEYEMKLREQLVCVQPIIDAAKQWRASLEGDGWSKEDIESGICRPGIHELMQAVDRLDGVSSGDAQGFPAGPQGESRPPAPSPLTDEQSK